MDWLKNFFAQLETLWQPLGIAETTWQALKLVYNETVRVAEAHARATLAARDLTTAKNLMLYGKSNCHVLWPASTGHNNEESLTGGLIPQLTELVIQIKKSSNYSENVGKNLGIVATPKPPIDWSKEKPVLRAEIVGGHTMRLHWTKGSAERIRFEVKRGEASWENLGDDTRSPFDDPQSLPDTPALWSYRAQYVYYDQLVGLVSDELETSAYKKSI